MSFLDRLYPIDRRSDPDGLLTEDEVAELLGVSPRTLQAWRLEGKGPPLVRLGTKMIRYRRSALQAWINQHTENPEDSARRGTSEEEA